MKKLSILSMSAALIGAMAVGEAQASPITPITVTGFFGSDHCSGTGGCIGGQTNGGSLSITGDPSGTVPTGTTGTLTFDVELANGNQFINSGFDASFGFSLNVASITYTAITPAANYTVPNGTGTLPTIVQTAGTLHMDGTGDFEFGLDGVGSGGSHPEGSSLMFTITGDGLDLGSFQASSGGNGGQFFAADIISGTNGTPTRNTGAIDITPSPTQFCTNCTSVPEPGALTLLGSALAGIGGLGGVRGLLGWWRRRDDEDDDSNTLAA